MTPAPPSLFAPASFVGWLRPCPGGRWRVVCEGADWAGCWDGLLRVRPAHVMTVEKIVLEAGRTPQQKRR